MKRKFTILGISLAAVVLLMTVYTIGWHNGQSGKDGIMLKEAEAAGADHFHLAPVLFLEAIHPSALGGAAHSTPPASAPKYAG